MDDPYHSDTGSPLVVPESPQPSPVEPIPSRSPTVEPRGSITLGPGRRCSRCSRLDRACTVKPNAGISKKTPACTACRTGGRKCEFDFDIRKHIARTEETDKPGEPATTTDPVDDEGPELPPLVDELKEFVDTSSDLPSSSKIAKAFQHLQRYAELNKGL